MAFALALSLVRAPAHDSTEITTGVFLRTNCLEVRVTLAAETAMRLLDADEHHVAALSTAGDLEKARPFLAECAAEFFQVGASGKPLSLLETNLALSVEDHVEWKLIYPRPEPGLLRIEAVRLKKLPADQPYGVMLTMVDLARSEFLGQKLLTADDSALEVMTAAPAPARPPAALPPRTPKNPSAGSP